jgi:hypothetical protein
MLLQIELKLVHREGEIMRNRIVLAAALFSAAVGPAQADPFWIYERNAAAPMTFGQFYITGQINGSVQHLPRYNSTVSIFQGGNIIPGSLNPDVVGPEPGGAIGYVFRDGTLPPWIGQRVRLEFSGNYLSMASHDSRSFQTTAGQIVIVNGVSGAPILAPGGLGQSFRFDDELRVERDGFRLRLKLAADHAFSPTLSFTPSIAVHGGLISDSYDYRYAFVSPAGGFIVAAPGRIVQRLRTSEYGLDLGGAANWQFMPGFALHASATVGVVHQRARLSGQDCLNNAVTVRWPRRAARATPGLSAPPSRTGGRRRASAAPARSAFRPIFVMPSRTSAASSATIPTSPASRIRTLRPSPT